ncbi:MAG: tRNA lysidine(34) synthetase TilS [Zavarzinella sp.]|nr:tRNA lysidine(34) synthetase TilS [Zavarzinella sp.]
MSHSGSAADPRVTFPAAVRANLDRLRSSASGPGVVAVSGGADSVALLRALADDPPVSDLVIAHLNHRLRGAESDADAAFVAGLFPNLPHWSESIDVAAAARGDNLEDTARRVRYDFFARVAREGGAGWVATAHTLDDQAETVLHRLIRGTGLRGLRGIAECRELAPGVRLLRPLLTLSRADVIAYLRALGQPWREDATNRDPAFTRNRIRHELLPVLRTFNPEIAEALARTAAQAEEVFAGIELVAGDLLQAAERPRAGRIVILNRPGLDTVVSHCLRELLHLVWEREGWPRGGMTHEHWQRAADVVRGLAPAWDLPGGIRIVGTARVVRVGPASDLSS